MPYEYYHVRVNEGSIASFILRNLSLNDLLLDWICPFIAHDVICSGVTISSLSIYDKMTIWKTSKLIDSNWPISKSKYKVDPKCDCPRCEDYDYRSSLHTWLNENNCNVTKEIYSHALTYIDDGTFKRYQHRFLSVSNDVFMIMPLTNREVRHNFDYVIKPIIEKYGFKINPIDKLEFTGQITYEILNQIVKAIFVVVDLTDEKPNCYYEVGYAKALKKEIVILAKKDTKIHFDLVGENCLFWEDYTDLKDRFDSRIKTLVAKLREEQKGES